MRRRYILLIVALSLGAGSLIALRAVLHQSLWDTPFTPSHEPRVAVGVADCAVSDAVTHENLAVYFVSGPDSLGGKSYLTLQEGLDQDLAVVHETGEVNELTIENRAAGADLFVQSGDIVKGGRQDRTFPHDLIVGPNSGRVGIDSYCVEHGRGSESADLFSSSSYSLSSSSEKRAAMSPAERRGNQRRVWSEVQETQGKLEAKLGEPVADARSATSLQLTLENEKLRQAVAPYLDRLGPAPDGRADVLGAVFGVNGKVVSADVYASPALFRKLWPKLLRGAATEAFTERALDAAVTHLAADDARALLRAAEGGAPVSEAVTPRSFVLTRESDRMYLFDTCDRALNNLVIHR
jgi:hypothetical protein